MLTYYDFRNYVLCNQVRVKKNLPTSDHIIVICLLV